MLLTDIKTILESCKTIAVVGLSARPFRASNSVSQYMRNRGYHIIPVNPNYEKIWDLPCYKSLLDLPETPDMVNIFRRSEAVSAIVDQAITIGTRIIWMQLGVFHEMAAQKAREAGISVIMDRCIKIEHARLCR